MDNSILSYSCQPRVAEKKNSKERRGVKQPRSPKGSKMKFKQAVLKYLPLLIFQLFIMIIFFVFARYSGPDDIHKLQETTTSATPTGPADAVLRLGFEDTHVMIFVGFGFLMTFLKKYGFSSVGFNLLLAALAIQWGILCQHAPELASGSITITKTTLLEADILSATVLITFGAVLGATTARQLITVVFFEIIFAAINLYLLEEIFMAADIGGSIAIHSFGAYFGLALSWAMTRVRDPTSSETAASLNGSNYVSDIFAMIGTTFLWIYWPSFNSGLATTHPSFERAVINTYLGLAACTVTTFMLSATVTHGKFEMVHIQNSTLAGGVAVGSVANMHISPGGAIAIGIGAAFISVFGYKYLTPKLKKFGIPDTCGVHNLHGMPGVYSGILSILFAAIATSSKYGKDLNSVFEGMDPSHEGRSAETQALFQFIALLVTLAIAIVGGVITGFIASIPIFGTVSLPYSDAPYWELP